MNVLKFNSVKSEVENGAIIVALLCDFGQLTASFLSLVFLPAM